MSYVVGMKFSSLQEMHYVEVVRMDCSDVELRVPRMYSLDNISGSRG